jgi:hypothetical protein
MKKLFPISLAIFILLSGALLFQMTSCSKSNSTPTVYSIQGLWTGTYAVDGQPGLGPQYFSFVIKPDGTMINETKASGQQVICLGTWTLTSDTLSCAYTCIYGPPSTVGANQTAKAYFNKNTGKLTSGVFNNVLPYTGSGTISLSRIN